MILKPRISGDISYKRRWEYYGAVMGIILGYPLFFLFQVLIGLNTDIIYTGLTFGLPDLLGNINSLLKVVPYLLEGIFASINDTSIANPYFPITFFFISFIEFPSCLVWFLPGFFIGYNRNKQFYNIDIKNNGWKVFWHGILFIELIIIIFSLGLLFTFLISFIPGFFGNEIALSFFGSGVLQVLLFFISPFFWIGLFSAGFGGFIGAKTAIKKISLSEVVIEEVESEKVFEEEGVFIEEEMAEIEAPKEMLWPEAAATAGVDDSEFGISEIDVSTLKEKIRASSTTTAASTQEMIRCVKCGKNLPAGAKFCNNCGNKLS